MRPALFPRLRVIVILAVTTATGLAAATAVATGRVTPWSAAVVTAVLVGLARIRRA
jgi:hypothetical protein